MKKPIIVIAVVLISFCLGFFTRSLIVRLPTSSESCAIHYCSCIVDNPAAQKHVFEVAETVNGLIRKGGAEFAKKHHVSCSDYDTRLIVDLNGNYKIVRWCSNRTAKVARLDDEYGEMASKHIRLYYAALDEMHQIYLDAQSTKAQEGEVE